MIIVDWGKDGDIDEPALLAASLTAAGLPAGISRGSLPEDLPIRAAYDMALHLVEGPAGPGDTLLLLRAEEIALGRIATLRRQALGDPGRCIVAGHFGDRQTEISVQAKLVYTLGREPLLLRLPDDTETLLAHPGAPVFAADCGRTPCPDGRARVLLFDPPIEEAGTRRALQGLAASRKIAVTILTNAKTQSELLSSGLGLPVYNYGEALPTALAARCDVAVFCTPLHRSYRSRMLLAQLAVSGAGLLDASEGFQLRRLDPAFVPAPLDLAELGRFLASDILPDLREMSDLARRSETATQARTSLETLAQAIGTAPAAPATRSGSPGPKAPKRIVFMPTNGVGLGHAQRCSLIASRLDRRTVEPVFAAFPSCSAMLKSYGFDVMPLVARSHLHAAAANDLVNYRRLDGLMRRPPAAFVFDGGYIFDSVFRTVLDRNLPSAWIRRGLWQAGQDNSRTLEREKIFDRVIVPREAFDELNERYSFGARVREVGPIVQENVLAPGDRTALRAALADRFGLPFTELVVTMLGGGVAADRTAQTIALAASLARRREALHLVVVWPTATLDPAIFGWPNTRVVKTHHAVALVAAADLYVSAAGYNSFHEALYNAVPTIFIPQMATYMDDQRARAAAAAERELAVLVEPHEALALDAAVWRLLDGEALEMRDRLRSFDLPPPGCDAAAAILADLAGACGDARSDAGMRRIA